MREWIRVLVLMLMTWLSAAGAGAAAAPSPEAGRAPPAEVIVGSYIVGPANSLSPMCCRRCDPWPGSKTSTR